MSAPRTWDRPFGSYAEFYRSEYGQHLSALHLLGTAGASVLEAHQTAGDWSDAPTPDLSITVLSSPTVPVTIDVGAGRYRSTMARGEVVLTPPGTTSSIQVAGEHCVRILALPYAALASSALDRGVTLPAGGDFGSLHAGLVRDSGLASLMNAIWHEVELGRPHGRLWTDGAILQVAAILVRLQHAQRAHQLRGGLASWQQRRALEHLTDNFAQDITLDALAAVVGLSTYHFARQFKRSFGLPPHSYLRRVRCEKARELLTFTKHSIGEIAAAVGYETPQAFARMFRAEVGVTPSEYRRKR